MAFKYFNVKNGLVTGNILLHASNSSISANAFTGNLNVTSTANLGNVGNVIITGGVANYVLSTDGTGNLNWVAQTGGTATANIQILDEGNILTNSVSSINFVGPGVVANNTGNAVTVTISGGESSSSISNGNSNVTVQANSNVNVSISGIPNILVVSGLGANVTGTMTASGNVSGANLITTGNVFAPAIVQNASFYDTRVSLDSPTGLVLITSNGNSTKFGPSGTVELGGASQVIGGTFGGSGITLGGSQTDIFQNRGGNVTVQTGTGGTISNTWTFAQNGSFTSPGNINASNANLGNSATANYFIGNFYGTANSATTAGTVTTNAQPNITSVGTLSSLAVTGNITSGNANLGNLVTANFFSGNGSLLTGITSAANANYANFAGTAYSVSGANVSGQVGNALIAGTVYTNAQPNITSVGTLTSLGVTGNITSGNANLGNLVVANFFSGDGSLLTGVTATAANANYANFAGTVLTNAQPNITSTGNLTGLTVSNSSGIVNFSNTANVSLGSVSNLHITGGSNAYVLSTDGTGNLNWVSVQSGIGIVVDNFTGDGTTSAFTLTTAPLDKDYTIVSLAATFQPRSTYNISGNTLTFTSPPANTSPIEVTIFEPSGGGGGTANIQILDEGNILTNSVSSINFVGAGVTASNTGNAVTVTIGGGTTASQVYGLGTVFSFGG